MTVPNVQKHWRSMNGEARDLHLARVERARQPEPEAFPCLADFECEHGRLPHEHCEQCEEARSVESE